MKKARGKTGFGGSLPVRFASGIIGCHKPCGETLLVTPNFFSVGQSSGTFAVLEARLSRVVAASPILSTILSRWAAIALPGCWLSGSAIAQTAWNAAFGLSPEYGLVDIDLVYFDATDMSEEGELQQAARIRALFPDLPLWIDAKNEARVHLWYEAKFGYTIQPYRSSEHAISTFPTTAGAVGIRPGIAVLTILAPFGLSDLLNCTVRPNKTQITQAIYEAKVSRWRSCWPRLTIIDWQAEGGA